MTTNIYGGTNPLNIASGNYSEQTISYHSLTPENQSELKLLGLEQKEIDELKAIVDTSSSDKSVLKDKAMKWLGSVTASIAGRRLYEKLLDIVNFVHQLTS